MLRIELVLSSEFKVKVKVPKVTVIVRIYGYGSY